MFSEIGENMITSVANQQIKHILQLNKKAKIRYEQRIFVVEGIKMSMEAPKEDIVKTYVSESFLADESKRKRIEGYSYEVVSDSVFQSMSDTKTPQGILCLVRMPQYHFEDLLGDFRDRQNTDKQVENSSDNGKSGKHAHLLILESIQDPGNLGTMIRTGEGAGVTGILMDKATVDIFHPKTIRATMGALYRVPFCITPDLQGAIQELKKKGVSMYAAHLSGTMLYGEPDYRGHTGFLIGNEGNGLSAETTRLADVCVRIPMEGNVESLNAAVAAALLMYEVKRQRG